jgi:ParB/RepB/Spo0J family partition protein
MSASKHLQRLLGARIESDAASVGAAAGVSAMTTAKVVGVDRIVPDPDQPRREFDPEEMRHLVGSLRDVGQTAPVKVRWDGRQDRYVLIDGERRWRAAREAGLTTLTAIVDNRDMAADRVLEMQVVENALRQDLTTLEAGAAYRSLMQSWGCTQQQLAERLHISQSKVSRALAALELPADLQLAVDTGSVAPVAAVKKAASRGGRRRTTPAPSKPVRIVTPAGIVTVAPKQGQTVVAVLTAALEREGRKGAA